MTDYPMKRYWMGEDIETLPREKLIEVIAHLGKQLEMSQSMLRATIDILMLRSGGEHDRL